MKITINNILEWDEDQAVAASIYSHEGEREYQRCLEFERSEKLDKEWTKGLPFTCQAECIDDAIEQYNEKYCPWPDILIAIEVDYDTDEEEFSKAFDKCRDYNF